MHQPEPPKPIEQTITIQESSDVDLSALSPHQRLYYNKLSTYLRTFYYNYCVQVNCSTRKERIVRRVLDYFLSTAMEINTYTLTEFMGEQTGLAKSSSYNQLVSTINTCIITPNKAKIPKRLTKKKEFRKKKDVPSEENVQIVMDFFSQEAHRRQCYLILQILAETGCRISEAVALKKKYLVKLKSYFLTFPAVKTTQREVQISDNLAIQLLNYIVDLNVKDDEKIFNYCKNSARNMLFRYWPKRFVPWIPPHDWRRRKVYLLHKSGLKPEEIMIYIGHKSIDQTMQYLKVDTVFEKEQLQIFTEN